MARLPRTFYQRSALVVARELLGQVLVRAHDDGERAAMIVETEAYLGETDLASHASRGRTARTDVMYGPPGHAYVYLIYGLHHCLNVVTGPAGVASAVLLRAVAPLRGIEPNARTDGPGRLTKAFDITRAQNRADLCTGPLFVQIGPGSRWRIARGPRIGVDYAGAWARKPFRFWLHGHPCVSR